ncbi:MAG TPA: LysR substrate-binding domain-containing protein [Mycobacteriales bacterium]|nr:LysR substrate-binding domain-containing protein [Mycobacteriales bacterium]
MEIRQLQYFLAVAEELHFGRAAERLHIVQSAVSQQLRRLERELGVDLFERTTRTVRLTEAGRRLEPEARAVLAAVERARVAIEDLRTERHDTVRLGTSDGLGVRLNDILAAFTERGGRLELVTAPTEERLKRVRRGDLDATLIRGPAEDGDLEFLELWTDPLMVALPARHDLAVRESIDVADLAGLPLRIASRERNRALHDLVVESCRTAGFEPEFGPEFTSAQDTLAAIGFGAPSWTVFYAPHADQIPVPGVVFRPLRNPTPIMRTYLVLRPDPPRAGVRALIDACNSIREG